ncbi:MAG TPA: response regulator transcription factor [Solirubrobacteraceae bacterium]|nr:response regulator transcription factor [Solirubrobacteraceae bacterium]
MIDEPRPSGNIRVLVVDDHDLFRAGLASLLGARPDIEVVAQASGGRMGVRLATELRPDVILMDVQMPDLDGPSATRMILGRQPSVRIVALTVVSDDDGVAAVLAAGACGFLAKDTPIDGVVLAIRAAAQGAAWLSPRASEVVFGQVRRDTVAHQPEPSLIDDLSARELDVLRLIARGLENAEIAEELGISPRTAKNHVSRVLAKLGQPGRVQAAVYAVRRGLS